MNEQNEFSQLKGRTSFRGLLKCILSRPWLMQIRTQMSYIELYISSIFSSSQTRLVQRFREGYFELNLFCLACVPSLQCFKLKKQVKILLDADSVLLFSSIVQKRLLLITVKQNIFYIAVYLHVFERTEKINVIQFNSVAVTWRCSTKNVF